MTRAMMPFISIPSGSFSCARGYCWMTPQETKQESQ